GGFGGCREGGYGRGEGGERLEVRLCPPGDERGERALPGARRAEEDRRAQLVSLDHSPEQPARAEDRRLADEFLQLPRPHPRRERRRQGGSLVTAKQVLGSLRLAHRGRLPFTQISRRAARRRIVPPTPAAGC